MSNTSAKAPASLVDLSKLRVLSTFPHDHKATKGPVSQICHTRASITDLRVDAIVNAANTGLRGGGGVDGAIHRAAGPQLMQQTREKYPRGCPTGDAVISGAFELPCRNVIHAVGPVYFKYKHDEAARLLAACYRRSLELAKNNGCGSVAFSAISAGVYGFPLKNQAEVALGAVRWFLEAEQQKKESHAQLTHVVFCSLPDDVHEVYEQLIPLVYMFSSMVLYPGVN